MKKNLESTKLKNIVEIIQKNCISKERKTNGAVFWKKHKKQIPAWIRAGIQLLFFVFFPSAFTAAFSGVKYIAGQMGTGAQIEITSFVLSLIIFCASTVVFVRFFCGFACAFGSLSDWVRAAYVWVCKKLKKKPVTLGMELTAALSLIKYAVLLLILFLCFGGTYVKLKGSSPWDVFSMLHAGNFALEGYFAGVVLLILILCGMCVQERFFCRILCPMGAIFSPLPVLTYFAPRRERENCISGCAACTKKCPSDIGLPELGAIETRGDCFMCQKCTGICPKGNIHCGVSGKLKGNELWFTAIRAVFLLFLYLWIGI